ncbi:MAG: hypothetical protein ACRDRU_06630 [Pseudonocardiaceae bacterium]
MTTTEIRAVEQVAVTPLQRLVVALAAVHAARATAIRHLTLDDLDLPNRRITIAGHSQRLGELTHLALLTWLTQRRASWPHTPNRHVLITPRTALGLGPVSTDYLKRHLLRRGVYLEHIRGDRVLHEALSVGADPLHLALVFNLSHTTANRYAIITPRASSTTSSNKPTPSSDPRVLTTLPPNPRRRWGQTALTPWVPSEEPSVTLNSRGTCREGSCHQVPLTASAQLSAVTADGVQPR